MVESKDSSQASIYDVPEIIEESDVIDAGKETEETSGTDTADTTDETEESNEDVPEYLILASALVRDSLTDQLRDCLAESAKRYKDSLSEDDRSDLIDKVRDGDYDVSSVVTLPDQSRAAWSIRPNRSEIEDGIDWAETVSAEVVIVDQIETLGSNLGEIEDQVSRLLDADVSIVIVRSGIELDPDGVSAETALSLLSGLSCAGIEIMRETCVEDLHRRGVETTHSGRPPFGFTTDGEGKLVPEDQIDEIRACLTAVKRNEMSKGAAARELSTTRKTINRCLDRPDLYGLK